MAFVEHTLTFMGLAGSRLVEKSVLFGSQDKFNELKMMTLMMALHTTKVSLVRV